MKQWAAGHACSKGNDSYAVLMQYFYVTPDELRDTSVSNGKKPKPLTAKSFKQPSVSNVCVRL